MRDLLPQLRRTLRATEPSQHQRQEFNTVFSDTTVRDDPKDTPEGSTETHGFLYAAGRVLSTATTPHRVLFTSKPSFHINYPTTPVIDYPNISNLSHGHRAHLHHTTDAPE